MSIVCAAVKDGEIAISCDTQSNDGSLTVSSKHIKNSNKLYVVNDSIMGIVGWNAISGMVEHLIEHNKESFKLNNRVEIFSSLVLLHEKMKDDYFIETKEHDQQPVESNQLDALIINKYGLFEIGSYREVNEFKTYWAIGSGRRIALGAMHALYDQKVTAKKVVESGVKAAAEFDDCCGLPVKTKVIKINKNT